MANQQRVSFDAEGTPLRPLSPRSIVLSVLLGSHPPQMPVDRILQFTSLFGLADGAVRTALSRLVATGDLANVEGSYRLAGRLVERQAQQDAGRNEPPADWDGTWWTVAVMPARRTMAERRAFRSSATGARLGELRPDLWLRPANITIDADLPGVLVTRGPIVVGDQRRLVGQLWDLDALDAEAASHHRSLAGVAERLDTRSGDADADDRALADAFAVLAAAQRFLRVEPQLPGELAPLAAGSALRAGYAEVVDRFRARLAEFFGQRPSAAASAVALSRAAR